MSTVIIKLGTDKGKQFDTCHRTYHLDTYFFKYSSTYLILDIYMVGQREGTIGTVPTYLYNRAKIHTKVSGHLTQALCPIYKKRQPYSLTWSARLFCEFSTVRTFKCFIMSPF